VALISALCFYPVKGCKGITVEQAILADTGLQNDRHWMVVDAAGRFVSQREQPRLALISPVLEGDRLRLTAPSLPPLELSPSGAGERLPVSVWRDTCAGLDQGAAAAEWLSEFLGQATRLVRFDGTVRRRSDPRYAGEYDASTEFADGFALLLISEASLADLNSRLPAPVPMNRFRPNIVISGVDAYAEDRILMLANREVELRMVKPCTRCVVTTTDQATAKVGSEPLRTLLTYRRHPGLGGAMFGQNAIVTRGAGSTLRVGDTLGETWSY
jgi:uncharacterized protein YcbX